MANIGSFEVDQWDGFMNRPSRGILTLPNFPNVDGVAMIVGAWSIPPDRITTAIITDSVSDADQLMDNIAELQADPLQAQSVTDPQGVDYSAVVISVNSRQNICVDGTVRVDSRWVLQQIVYVP